MNIFQKAFNFLDHRELLHWIPDEQYLKIVYKMRFGTKLDLNDPKTLNEKLQWIKLNDRKEQYSLMVDKYEAKKLIKDQIGEEYVIPTLGIYETFDDIDFESLPNAFVMKCTHNSGGLVVCRDKSKLDIKDARKIIEKSLRQNYYWHGREWPYKNVKGRIIIEPLLQNSDGRTLDEYNFFCFNGDPRFFMHCYGDRDKGEIRYDDYYYIDGEKLPIRWGYDSSDKSIFKRFDCYEDMILKSRIMSKNIPFLRVDFYLVDNKPVMGELTFFNWGGMAPIDPPEYDLIFGDMLKLR